MASQVLSLPRKQDASLEKSIAGLLLAKMLAAKGQYQRIGTFKVRHEGIKATLRGAVNARTMPEGDYLDFDGCESYTIRIV
jgi:hypothetical protein